MLQPCVAYWPARRHRPLSRKRGIRRSCHATAGIVPNTRGGRCPSAWVLKTETIFGCVTPTIIRERGAALPVARVVVMPCSGDNALRCGGFGLTIVFVDGVRSRRVRLLLWRGVDYECPFWTCSTAWLRCSASWVSCSIARGDLLRGGGVNETAGPSLLATDRFG